MAEKSNVQPAHSELGASSYYRWKACPGSVKLCRTAPVKASSIYAEEGTQAHELAAQILLGEHQIDYTRYDSDMIEAVNVYVNFCSYISNTKSFPILKTKENNYVAQYQQIVFIEKRFDLSKFFPGLFGTADFVFYNSEIRTLFVVDYKHGAGIPVDVEENTQLMYYGLGALNELAVPVAKIVLVIVQPRAYHKDGPIRRWETTPSRMVDFLLELVDDARRTTNPTAPLEVGDHCRFCAASAVCPAQYEKNLNEARSVFQVAPLETEQEPPSELISYDAKKLGDTLRALDRIEAWAKSVRAFAYEEAITGRPPAGFKLVDKRPTRKWKSDEVDQALFDKFGREMYAPLELLSPAQMEKKFSGNKDFINSLCVSESSGKKLAPLSDDRLEYDKLKEARKIFKPLNKGEKENE